MFFSATAHPLTIKSNKRRIVVRSGNPKQSPSFTFFILIQEQFTRVDQVN